MIGYITIIKYYYVTNFEVEEKDDTILIFKKNGGILVIWKRQLIF